MDSTREDAPLPTMVVRLKNTVRLQVKADAAADIKRRFGREFVVTELLREVFGVSACLIFCLQDFSNSGFMDLTFFQLKDCVAFYEAWEKKKDHQRLTGLHLFPAFAQDFLPLTIHLYNPFVEDGDVLTFLARYCETVRGGERLKDRFGIWTGKRRYLVKLRADTASPGGLVHPPGTFFIGSNRGFLHYPGQPVYCRRCGAQGHVKADCTGQRCRFCGSAEHIATACPEPKKLAVYVEEEIICSGYVLADRKHMPAYLRRGKVFRLILKDYWKLCEDVTGDREKKCCKVQVQEPVLRRVHRKEAGGEMDTGERGVGESGVEGRGGGGGALERVKSILREDKREGEQRDEGGEGGDWMEVMGKGKGKKCLERKASM
uniref:CCHC-type domain-containing protein n=1 Tax=Cyprinus carpio carpio TaxID=630221 RepID=A0A9J8D6E7_CYPCA